MTDTEDKGTQDVAIKKAKPKSRSVKKKKSPTIKATNRTGDILGEAMLSPSSFVLKTAVRAIADIIDPGPSVSLTDIISGNRKEKEKSIEEKKTALVKELLESGIDPQAFDALLSNEMDRRLKVKFGITFLVFTFIFTAASYAIVILDGIYNWGISEVAITALIIETPIQFIGLLYIIARNLFPQNANFDNPGKIGSRTQRVPPKKKAG